MILEVKHLQMEHFTTLKCTAMYGDIGDSTIRSNIYASEIDCNTITGNVCAIYDDFITLPLSTNKVVTPKCIY